MKGIIKKWKRIKHSFRIYFAQRRREAIINIVYGGFSGLLFFEVIHNIKLFKNGLYMSVIISVLVSLLLFFIDFFLFHFSGRQKVQNEINKLNKVIQSAVELDNALVTESALGRIRKETAIIHDLKENTLRLESLQNYEYIREIFMRVMTNIMKKGDHYITLSNIDFWTMSPQKHLDRFIDKNMQAITFGKHIHRLIVLDHQKYFSGGVLTDKEKRKKEMLREVLKELEGEMKITDTNYFDHFKTLCYLTPTIEKNHFDKYLPSVIVVKNNCRDVFLATVDKLEDIEKENPVILIRHFKFDKLKITKTPGEFCVINTLNELKRLLVDKQNKGDNTDADDFLFRVLEYYLTAFTELRTLYRTDTDGKKHENVISGASQTIIKDIPMMLSSWT